MALTLTLTRTPTPTLTLTLTLTLTRWRSTPHRVASPRAGSAAAARSRVTAMLFTGPSLETIVQPAPTCGAPLFPTTTAREHLTAMATSQSKVSQ